MHCAYTSFLLQPNISHYFLEFIKMILYFCRKRSCTTRLAITIEDNQRSIKSIIIPSPRIPNTITPTRPLKILQRPPQRNLRTTSNGLHPPPRTKQRSRSFTTGGIQVSRHKTNKKNRRMEPRNTNTRNAHRKIP